jgi:hypothetical protein
MKDWKLMSTNGLGTLLFVPAIFVFDLSANDNFADRSLIPMTPGRAMASNAGASTESGEPVQSGFNRWGKTLWWRWTAPASGTVAVDTSGSSFNTFLGIYTGAAVNALTILAQNDNASLVGVGASSVTFNALQGTEYQIQVGGIFTGGGGGTPSTGNIQVNVALLPSVTITSPSSGSVFPVGGIISVKGNASSISGIITNVSLYNGPRLLGSTTNTPHNFVVSNPPVGTNSFYAVAADSLGQVGTSAVVRVLCANVGITLTAPSDTVTFLSTNPLAVSAFSMLPAGSITNVRFFVDGQLIGQDSTMPFSAVWSSVTPGPHRFTANGRDDSGNIHFATPIHIAVARTLLPAQSVWKYLDNGTNQGTNWYAPNFLDDSWRSGPAELGYGDGDEATRVEDNATPGYNNSDTSRYMTTYFRRSFVVTNAVIYTNLLLNVKTDDGAVVYLNGQEAARFNMNTGIVTYLTAARFAGDDGRTFVPITSPANSLIEGSNVVAVEVHQSTADSTDLTFDMELLGIPIAALPVRIESIVLRQTNVILAFRADANVSYTLEYTSSLGSWETLQMISPAATDRIIEISQVAFGPSRFYRLRSQ